MRPIDEIFAEWYDSHDEVRRVFVYELGDEDSESSESGLLVVVALTPTMDGDDAAPIWFARVDEWQRDLEEKTARPVRLYPWNRTDGIVAYAASESAGRYRVADFGWRE